MEVVVMEIFSVEALMKVSRNNFKENRSAVRKRSNLDQRGNSIFSRTLRADESLKDNESEGTSKQAASPYASDQRNGA